MRVRTEKLRALGADASIAKRRALGGAGGDSNVQGIAAHQRVIDGLKNQGCDAVVLGCTEIPLIVNDSNSSLPTLDSTRLLARAALRRAVA